MKLPLVFFPFLLIAAACTSTPINPSFPITATQAHEAIIRMRFDPRPLDRPLVVIGGFLDPGISPAFYEQFFHGISPDAKIIPVTIGFCDSFAECRKKVIVAVDAACPSADPIWTAKVDIVGASLGGLVARYAAAPSPDPVHPRRLQIGRLFSISSPQAGAKLANFIALTDFHREVRSGSAFLTALASNDAEVTYELIPYVELNDNIVGPAYAAPPGETALWLPNDSIFPSHFSAMFDERILSDIARRLRGETSFSHFPPTALPPASNRL